MHLLVYMSVVLCGYLQEKGGMEDGRERGTEELPLISYTLQHHLKSRNKLTLHW